MKNKVIFLHSMFRTGSTFLSKCFADESKYHLYYEPFHPTLAKNSWRKGRAAGAHREQTRAQLNHVLLPGGYWEGYSLNDPLTDQPVSSMMCPKSSTFDVFNGFSKSSARYLSSAIRAATNIDKIPVFGFCRSGLQVGGMRETHGGTHVYLVRAPFPQFKSYLKADESYFITYTILQLLCSKKYGRMAASLLGYNSLYGRLLAEITGLVPRNKLVYKLAKNWIPGLPIQKKYSAFYLAWRLSKQHAKKHSDIIVSLNELHDNQNLKDEICGILSINMDGLQKMDSPQFEEPEFIVTSARVVEEALALNNAD